MSILYIEIYLVIGLLVDIVLTLIDLEVIFMYVSEGLYLNLLIGQILTIILWPAAILLRFFKRR